MASARAPRMERVVLRLVVLPHRPAPVRARGVGPVEHVLDDLGLGPAAGAYVAQLGHVVRCVVAVELTPAAHGGLDVGPHRPQPQHPLDLLLDHAACVVGSPHGARCRLAVQRAQRGMPDRVVELEQEVAQRVDLVGAGPRHVDGLADRVRPRVVCRAVLGVPAVGHRRRLRLADQPHRLRAAADDLRRLAELARERRQQGRGQLRDVRAGTHARIVQRALMEAGDLVGRAQLEPPQDVGDVEAVEQLGRPLPGGAAHRRAVVVVERARDHLACGAVAGAALDREHAADDRLRRARSDDGRVRRRLARNPLSLAHHRRVNP